MKNPPNKRVKVRYDKVIPIAFSGGMIIGLPVALIFYFTKSEWLSGIIALVGAFIIVLMAIWKGIEYEKPT